MMRLFKKIIDRFISHYSMDRAASLAYTTLLSLVPIAILSFGVFSWSPSFKQAFLQIQHFIFKHFVVSSGAVIEDYLEKTLSQSLSLSVVGVISLIFTAVLMLHNIETAFNDIWEAKGRRRIFSRILMYLVVLIAAPVVIIFAVIISPVVFQPFLFAVVVLTFLYYVVPAGKVFFKNAFISAIIVSILIEISKKLFGLYLHYFPSYDVLYGALAAIPIFLIWLYIVWLIILLGVAISAELFK